MADNPLPQQASVPLRKPGRTGTATALNFHEILTPMFPHEQVPANNDAMERTQAQRQRDEKLDALKRRMTGLTEKFQAILESHEILLPAEGQADKEGSSNGEVPRQEQVKVEADLRPMPELTAAEHRLLGRLDWDLVQGLNDYIEARHKLGKECVELQLEGFISRGTWNELNQLFAPQFVLDGLSRITVAILGNIDDAWLHTNIRLALNIIRSHACIPYQIYYNPSPEDPHRQGEIATLTAKGLTGVYDLWRCAYQGRYMARVLRGWLKAEQLPVETDQLQSAKERLGGLIDAQLQLAAQVFQTFSDLIARYSLEDPGSKLAYALELAAGDYCALRLGYCDGPKSWKRLSGGLEGECGPLIERLLHLTAVQCAHQKSVEQALSSLPHRKVPCAFNQDLAERLRSKLIEPLKSIVAADPQTRDWNDLSDLAGQVRDDASMETLRDTWYGSLQKFYTRVNGEHPIRLYQVYLKDLVDAFDRVPKDQLPEYNQALDQLHSFLVKGAHLWIRAVDAAHNLKNTQVRAFLLAALFSIKHNLLGTIRFLEINFTLNWSHQEEGRRLPELSQLIPTSDPTSAGENNECCPPALEDPLPDN